jgi:hypothetical protein
MEPGSLPQYPLPQPERPNGSWDGVDWSLFRFRVCQITLFALGALLLACVFYGFCAAMSVFSIHPFL